MPSTLIDMVKINVIIGGSGALTLGDAIPAYRGREALTNGNAYGYSIQVGSNFEFGRGTYLSSGHQFVRTVLGSSNGGAPLDLPVNCAIAIGVFLAEDYGNMAQLIALLSSQTNGAVIRAIATELIGSGAFVNLYGDGVSSDTFMRNADASDPDKFCNAFSPALIEDGATGLAAPFGINSAVGTVVPAGQVWLSDATPGAFTTTAPSASGSIVQPIGVSIPGMGIWFMPQPWILL